MSNQITTSPGNQNDTLAKFCSGGFFFDENVTNLCRPICGETNPLPLAIVITQRVSIIIGVIASLVVFILALTVQKKSL